MRVAVCLAQVPFVRGGAELLSERLVEELRERGHEAELVTVPFKWYPGERVLTQAFLWRLLDLEEADGRPVERVIATKFPSYGVRHPNKVVWLVHQFRQAYELDRTDLGQFDESPEGRALRRAVHRFDRVALGEAQKLYAISQNVAGRLERSTGLAAEVLLPPPQELAYRCDEYGDFVLSVGRLDRAKRVDLLLEALAVRPSLRAVIAGDGPDRDRLEELARTHGLDGRAVFAGRVSDDELTDLYARCLAVYYAPVDEDFGFVPYEAFLAEKPVVTTTDAGGPLEVVQDRRNGLVCEPAAAPLAEACSWLGANDDTREGVGAGRPPGRGAALVGPRDRAAARMRVAYYSPLPPERSGVADYSAMLLPELEQRLEIDVVRRGARRRARRAARHADLALYHVGNDPERHWWIVEELRRRPGVVVLHDFVLHHLIAGMTVGRGDANGYLDAMQREAGPVGRMLAHGVIDGLLPPVWERHAHEYPLTGEVLSSATGVIVHSAYVERRVREHGYAGPVWRIPLAAWPMPAEMPDAGLPPGRLVVGSFGHLNPAKRVPQLLDGFALLRERVPEALLLLVGSVAPGVEFAGSRRRAPLRLRAGGPPLVAARGDRHLRQPPLPDDGRDLRNRSSRAGGRPAAGRQRRRLVLGATGRGRAEGSRRRRRGRGSRRPPDAPGRGRRA